MLHWFCGRRKTINIVLLMILALFYTISFLIFKKLVDSDMTRDDEKTLQKLLAVKMATIKDLTIQSSQRSKENDFIYNKQENRQVVNNEKWFRKPYSPNAVFKDGVLGNYESKLDMNRTGPGEYGVPVPQDPSELDAIEKSSIEYGFNMVNSDKISLDRILNDVRQPECKYWHYPENLPNASVVVVFHNEGWSPFVRTVHSVINMSPPQLLHEVVLVDDCSDKEHLKSRLEEHMSQFGNKVKIVRNKEREGLIRSRNIGVLAATGDVVVFLDAHCECSPNWLPPLLTRIAYDRTIMAAPIVDVIDWSSYKYISSFHGAYARGIFEWGFFYKEKTVPQKELEKRKYSTEPYWSPTNAGGLFAIDREYFLLLGLYDPQLAVWGGENYELAFKLWQCGGSSEWVPCSRVGHIYRHHGIDRKFKITTKLSTTLINYVRVVEVWMDHDFKEYFYRREPQSRGYPVDISKELQFKIDNQCKNFSWFMENVAYDIYSKFSPPAPNKAWGQIRLRKSNGIRCLDFGTEYKGKRALTTYDCASSNSVFRLNTQGQIGTGERCILANDDNAVTMEWCSTTDLTGPWQWEQGNGLLYNKNIHKCLAADHPTSSKIYFVECDANAVNQKWDILEWYPWK